MTHPYPAPPIGLQNSVFGIPCDPVANALAEDVGSGDLTSRFFLPTDVIAKGRIFSKEPCVIAGVAAAIKTFLLVDSTILVSSTVADGDCVDADGTVLKFEGRISSLLTAERVALNFLQRLSAVATLTRRFVDAIEGTSAKILDTRKTTPGLRTLEKAAVLAGGGTNHRHGLFDAVMIKDNHLAAAGDINELQRRIDQFRDQHPGVMIEIEADTLEQARQFFSLSGVAVVLLDNMPLDEIRRAVAEKPGHIFLEASGGVSLETIRSIAETGIDFISVGALTHSAKSIDLSMEIWNPDARD